MNQEDLRDLLRARPFHPFRLHLTDGSTFDIAHPDLMIPGRRAAVLGVGGQPELGMPDRFVTITLLHIVRVETLEQSQTGNQAAQN
jgi:hypothetical protein